MDICWDTFNNLIHRYLCNTVLDKIHVPIDLSAYKGKYTVDMAKEEIPGIEERLIEKYEREIAQKLNIS